MTCYIHNSQAHQCRDDDDDDDDNARGPTDDDVLTRAHTHTNY